MSSARWVQNRCLEALDTKQDGASSIAFAQKGATQIYSSQISKKNIPVQLSETDTDYW